MLDYYARINKIRRKVFEEVSRIAYSTDSYDEFNNLPYKIMADLKSSYRSSIFLERAIIAERVRLALCLPLRTSDASGQVCDDLEHGFDQVLKYRLPLMNVIDFACNGCPESSYFVTNLCEKCLAKTSREKCPNGAINILPDGRSVIDQSACIKCGRCSKACPFGAIVKRERPCAAACGVNAIGSDENGKAKIDYDKCVSCGMCMVNCPFGAIADKSVIYQLIQALKAKEEVYAIIAPSFVGQFGPKVTLKTINNLMHQLGFTDTVEVAIGADICTVEEAEDFLENVPNNIKFMATSCCPAWRVMTKKNFPEFRPNISLTNTPMVITAHMIKEEHPNCKVCFIGPCSAKKQEAFRESVKSGVDYVLTYEELQGMYLGKGINLDTLKEEPLKELTSSDGRGFAVAQGVAQAVVNVCKLKCPEREIKVASAQGLDNCKKMLQDAKKGVYDGYLLEGMGCPLGCASGAGTINSYIRTKIAVGNSQKEAAKKSATESEFLNKI